MILDYIKSRVKGDLQARFRERLAGETPACLLDLAMQKSITERSWKVEYDNARSEGTRKGWGARLERQCQTYSIIISPKEHN